MPSPAHAVALAHLWTSAARQPLNMFLTFCLLHPIGPWPSDLSLPYMTTRATRPPVNSKFVSRNAWPMQAWGNPERVVGYGRKLSATHTRKTNPEYSQPKLASTYMKTVRRWICRPSWLPFCVARLSVNLARLYNVRQSLPPAPTII